MDGCSTFCIHKRSLQSQTDDTIISITKITLLKLVLWLVNAHFTVCIICIVKICANRSRMGTEIVIVMEFRKPYLTIYCMNVRSFFGIKKSVFAFSRLKIDDDNRLFTEKNTCENHTLGKRSEWGIVKK